MNSFPGFCWMLSSAGRPWTAPSLPLGAAEKAVPPQNGVGHTTLLGETAYVRATIVCGSGLVAGLPQPISHVRRVAASPSGSRRPTSKRSLESPSSDLRLAGAHLVYRRFRSRMLRNSTRLVRRWLSVAQTSRSHLLRFPHGAGGTSHAGVAEPGSGGAATHFHAVRRTAALSRVSSFRVRRLGERVPG